MIKLFFKRHLVQICLLLLILAAGSLLLVPLKQKADQRAEILKHRIIGRLEATLGITISYQSISPALLSVVTVKGLEVEFQHGDFHVDTLQVHYNPFRSLRKDKNDPMRMISKVTVAQGHLNMTLEGEAGVGVESTASETMLWAFLTGKTVSLSGISADIVLNEDTTFSAQNVSLHIQDDNGTIRYTFDSNLTVDIPDSHRSDRNIFADISSAGTISSEEKALNGRLDFRTLNTERFAFKPLAVDFTYSASRLTARRIFDIHPLNLSFTYSPESWSLSGEALGLTLRDIVRPNPSGMELEDWFSSELDGRFLISGISGTSSMDYFFDLGFSIPPGPMHVAWHAKLSIQGNQETAFIDQMSFSSEHASIEYSGNFSLQELGPRGHLTIKLEDDLLKYPVSAAFNLKTTGATISAEPVLVQAADLVFHDFRFLVIRESHAYALSLLAVPVQPDDSAARSLFIDALIDFGSEPVIYGFADMAGFDSSNILKLVGLGSIDSIGIFQNSSLNLKSYFEANNESWALTVEEVNFTHNENPSNSVSFRGRMSPESWSLDNLRISWNSYVVNGSVFGKASNKVGAARGRFVIQEEVFPFNVNWYADGRVHLMSNFGLSANIGPQSLNGRSIQVLSQNSFLPLPNGQLVSHFDIRGRIARHDWEIYLNTFTMSFSELTHRTDIDLRLNGTINQESIVLPKIILIDDIGELKGNMVVERMSEHNQLKGRLFFSGIEGEFYDLGLRKNGPVWDVGLEIRDAWMNRMGGDRVSGQLNLSGRMNGTLESPIVELKLETENGVLDDHPFHTEAKATMSSGRLRLQDIFYEHKGVALKRGLALVNLNEGFLKTTAELQAHYNQVPVSTGFSLAMDFGHKLALTELREIGNGEFSGTLATQKLLWNSKEHMPAFTFHFVKDADGFTVQSPDAKVLNVNYDYESGELDVLSGAPMPIMVRGGGTLKDAQADLSFPELEIDPVLINYVMLRDPILLQYYVVFQSGRFIGNLDLIGPINDPNLYGTIHVENLKVDTPYTYASIKPADTEIHLNGDRVSVDRIEIPVGQGIMYGEGYLVLDQWIISEFDMIYGGKAGANGAGVPVFYPLIGVDLDGLFTGEIRMAGGNNRFLLTGDFWFPYLKASLGSPVIPTPQPILGAEPPSVFLDFNFITGNNNAFFLPNEQVKIVKAIAEPENAVNLKYSSESKTMAFTGRIPIKSGDIFYFDRDFQITEGSIEFNESLEVFDPILAFQAETRVKDELGENITVALVYNAPIMSDFNPRIITIPPRSESEILALFGQAVIPYSESGDTDAASTVLLATGGMFGQVGFVQPFEEVLRKGFNLDMVTIQTDIVENTLAQGLKRNNDVNSENTGSFGLGQYLDNTSLFVGKYIGNDLFVSGTLSANYFEGQRLQSVFGGLEFETSVNLEMETPFFNLGWSYLPGSLTSRSFVEDNRISLRWQFAF